MDLAEWHRMGSEERTISGRLVEAEQALAKMAVGAYGRGEACGALISGARFEIAHETALERSLHAE